MAKAQLGGQRMDSGDIACDACNVVYDLFERIPKILYCGHHFCLLCLRSMKKGEYILCFTCGFTTPAPRDLAWLPTHVDVIVRTQDMEHQRFAFDLGELRRIPGRCIMWSGRDDIAQDKLLNTNATDSIGTVNGVGNSHLDNGSVNHQPPTFGSKGLVQTTLYHTSVNGIGSSTQANRRTNHDGISSISMGPSSSADGEHHRKESGKPEETYAGRGPMQSQRTSNPISYPWGVASPSGGPAAYVNGSDEHRNGPPYREWQNWHLSNGTEPRPKQWSTNSSKFRINDDCANLPLHKGSPNLQPSNGAWNDENCSFEPEKRAHQFPKRSDVRILTNRPLPYLPKGSPWTEQTSNSLLLSENMQTLPEGNQTILEALTKRHHNLMSRPFWESRYEDQEEKRSIYRQLLEYHNNVLKYIRNPYRLISSSFYGEERLNFMDFNRNLTISRSVADTQTQTDSFLEVEETLQRDDVDEDQETQALVPCDNANSESLGSQALIPYDHANCSLSGSSALVPYDASRNRRNHSEAGALVPYDIANRDRQEATGNALVPFVPFPFLRMNDLTNTYYLDFKIEGRRAGRVVVETFPAVAPMMSANFAVLCLGQRGMSFKGCNVFQTWYSQSIISGDTESNTGNTGRSSLNVDFFEPDQNSLPPERGMIGFRRLARSPRSQKGKVSSQFRILLNRQPNITGLFGYIKSGIDVIDSIAELDDGKGNPRKRVFISDCGKL